MNSNRIFRYTLCITPKRETSLQGLRRVIAPGQHIFFEELLQRWQGTGNTASDLTGPKFEPQTSRS